MNALDLLASLVIETGQRWGEVATPVQWEDAAAVLDPDGPPYHFLTRARGYDKTTGLAGIAIAAMICQLPPASRLYGLAADKDQGRLLIDALGGFTRRTAELGGAISVDAYKATCSNGSILEVIPADAASAYGLRPAFLVVDEVAQWNSGAGPRTLWEATTTALAKVPGARLVVLTSAGDPAHWSRAILDHALGDPLWHVHEVPGPPPWADPDRLDEQRRRLPDSSWRRLFLNEWTAAEDRLTSLDDLRQCVTLAGPLPPVAGTRYVVGLDIGLKDDRTVAALCHGETIYDTRGRVNGVRVILDRLQVWQGTRAAPVDLSDVEAWLVEAATAYGAVPIVDPWQAALLVQRLRDRGIWATEFPFTQASVGRLAVAVHTSIRSHLLALPDDPELIDELAHVRLRETSTPGVIRMDHDAGRHDDRAIALGLACVALLEQPEAGDLSHIYDEPDTTDDAADEDVNPWAAIYGPDPTDDAGPRFDTAISHRNMF